MIQDIVKILIFIGFFLIFLGIFILIFSKFNLKIPGDVYIKKENFEFYFPLGTSILISLIISLILYIISKIR